MTVVKNNAQIQLAHIGATKSDSGLYGARAYLEQVGQELVRLLGEVLRVDHVLHGSEQRLLSDEAVRVVGRTPVVLPHVLETERDMVSVNATVLFTALGGWETTRRRHLLKHSKRIFLTLSCHEYTRI